VSRILEAKVKVIIRSITVTALALTGVLALGLASSGSASASPHGATVITNVPYPLCPIKPTIPPCPFP
jgi:hypothetical protein